MAVGPGKLANEKGGGPQLSFTCIKAVAAIIMGDAPPGETETVSPYRTHPRIDEFFADELELRPLVRPEGSRIDKTREWVKSYNGTTDVVRIIEASVRPVDYVNTPFHVADAASKLNEYLGHDGVRLDPTADGFKLVTTTGVAVVPPTDAPCVLGQEYVREMIDKCDHRLNGADLEGAITVARTLLEVVLRELEVELTGRAEEYGGDLMKQYKAVAKLLKIDDTRDDLDENFRQVARGLTQVVAGLAPIRNKMSDGHARRRKPVTHHARLVVNSAKTVVCFLVESFGFQKQGRSRAAEK